MYATGAVAHSSNPHRAVMSEQYGGNAPEGMRVSVLASTASEVRRARDRVQSIADEIRVVADSLCGQSPPVPQNGQNTKDAAPIGTLSELNDQLARLHCDLNGLYSEFGRLSSL